MKQQHLVGNFRMKVYFQVLFRLKLDSLIHSNWKLCKVQVFREKVKFFAENLDKKYSVGLFPLLAFGDWRTYIIQLISGPFGYRLLF